MLFTLKWLLPYWKRHKYRMLAIVALGMVSAALNALYPYIIKQIINGLNGGITRELLRRDIYLILGVGIGGAVVNIAAQRNRAYMNMRLEWEMRQHTFEHILKLDQSFFHRYTTGDLVTRLVDDISNKISWFSCSGVFRFIQSVFTLIGAVLMMLLLNRWLTLWVLAPAPLLLAASIKTGRKLEARYDALQKTISLIYDFLETCFTGIKLIKANAKENAQGVFFSGVADAQADAEISVARLDIVFSYFYHSANFISISMVFLAGGLMVISGKASLGDLIAFYFYAGMIMMPLMDISQFFVSGNRAGASIKRVDELLQAKSAVKKPASPAPAPARVETVQSHGVSVVVGKDGVHLLKGISFRAKSGQLISVVGKIGSGKSSLLAVLTRFSEFSAGEIFLNGIDIRKFTPAAIRERIGLVTQDPFIMTDTVLNNITLGRENIPEGAVAAAIRVSQLKHDISKLPKGLETFVGTRGFALSGGQKQRVAVARALLTRPEMLLLDDATSAMDAQTEDNFWHDFRKELPDAICLIVTHRVKTIEHSDLILTLDEGRLAEKGTHAELMALNGLYKQIYERQKLEEELKNR
ncbi:MAG: ABC transporter ATP-binding protein [Elusimicrobia bacterium]|nr:ABC transporter ATP-binding protein [Elusimicrobiota bacterium]